MKLTAAQVPQAQAQTFVMTLAANVDNERLSDKDFRQFVSNSLGVFSDNPVEANVRSGRTSRCYHGVSHLNHCTECD